MKKINSNMRVAELDTLSDVLVRLYKDSCAAENAVSKDANLSLIMAEAEKLSADITTAIKSEREQGRKRDFGKEEPDFRLERQARAVS